MLNSIHGKNDTIVLPDQSEKFFWKAKGSGKQVSGFIFNGEEHDLEFYSRVVLPLKFFEAIVAGKYPSWLSFDAPIYTDANGIKKLISGEKNWLHEILFI